MFSEIQSRTVKQSTKYLVVVLMALCFSGCNLIFLWAIRPCEPKISVHTIKGTHCELGNGVYMEELKVHTFTEAGLPDSSESVVRFSCGNTGSVSPRNFPNKLNFDKENPGYTWGRDSVKYYFVLTGYSRSYYKYFPKTDTIEAVSGFAFHASDGTTYTTSPVAFKPATWYYCDLSDPSLNCIFVYFDEKMRSKVYTIKSGVSPI